MTEKVPQQKPDDSGAGIGCVVLVGLAIWLIYTAWDAAFGCFLADQFNYVTSQCALSHLQKPACTDDKDVLQVDEVTDTSYTDGKGVRSEVRTVIYRFRKRPISGPVSDAVLRDSTIQFKTQNGNWVSSC
jgi:hypothetical protein